MGNSQSTSSDPITALTDSVNQETIKKFADENPSRQGPIFQYKNAIDLFANKFSKFSKVLEAAEQEMKIINPETNEEVGILHSYIIKNYINPQWADFKQMYELTRKTERDILGLGKVSELAKKNRQKIDSMYNGIQQSVNSLLAKHTDLQQPYPIKAYDPNTLEQRLKRINAMGGRRTRHRRRKLKRKTRR
jgi:hypothetical protein